MPAYWGNDDGYRLPDPATIQYIVLDLQQVGEAQKALVASFIAPGGPYQVLFDETTSSSPSAAGRRRRAPRRDRPPASGADLVAPLPWGTVKWVP